MTMSSAQSELADACNEAQDTSRSKTASDQPSDSYIVVSDVHLGAEGCCRREFEGFLSWLADSVHNRHPLQVQLRDGPGELDPPRTLILLGDILELWAPRGNEQYNVIRDSLSVFEKLNDLACHIVYVLGNHDMMLCGGHEFGVTKVRASQDKAPKLVDLLFKNATHLEVLSRHYPCEEDTRRAQPLKLGNCTYLFVHGHQFDPDFQRAGISIRAVPLIAGLSSAFDVIPRYGRLSFGSTCFAVWLLFIVALVASVFHVVPIDPLWWGLLLIFFGYPAVSWVVATQMKHVWEFKQRLTSFVTRSPCEKDVSSWPWPMHAHSKMRYKHISDFVRDSKYFDLDHKHDHAEPQIFVFGHTHVPELCKPMLVDETKPTSKRRFVNCGSWLQPSERKEKRSVWRTKKDCPDARDADNGLKYNTFVYIDAKYGPRLFHWKDNGPLTTLKAEEIGAKDCVPDESKGNVS
jgi:UDP-2,3-diacylglucosamine pyrophosphatase LpxH